MGSCMLVRRAAFEEVGPFDERYFLFSEEVDWMRRATDRGWSVVFTPTAECVHVGGASHGGRLFRENVRGHLRYLSLHGQARARPRARAGSCGPRCSSAGGCIAASARASTARWRPGSARATSRR